MLFAVYPLAALFPDEARRNAFDSVAQVGLIVYLFGLSLYTQLGLNRARKTSVTG